MICLLAAVVAFSLGVAFISVFRYWQERRKYLTSKRYGE